ncbi:MAG TPA: type II toxin-antitoxin system PemK/MazF family toxin [Hanamia sp.]|nr:type II toxin-antitoxin system PemK/MazF family toxin [Hanamia sp.]
MSSYLKGDIVLVPFPFSDLTASKVRPAIVISNSTVNKTNDLILAQITSNIHDDTFSYSIDDKYLTHTLNMVKVK